jgi:hypothetical protein
MIEGGSWPLSLVQTRLIESFGPGLRNVGIRTTS